MSFSSFRSRVSTAYNHIRRRSCLTVNHEVYIILNCMLWIQRVGGLKLIKTEHDEATHKILDEGDRLSGMSFNLICSSGWHRLSLFKKAPSVQSKSRSVNIFVLYALDPNSMAFENSLKQNMVKPKTTLVDRATARVVCKYSFILMFPFWGCVDS